MNIRKIKKLKELNSQYKYDLAVIGDQFSCDEEKLSALLGYNFMEEMTAKINDMYHVFEGDEDVDAFSLFILNNLAVICADIVTKQKKDLKLLDFFSTMFLEKVNENILEKNQDDTEKNS